MPSLQIKQGIVEQLFDQIGNAILWDKRIDSQVLKYVEFHEGHFCHVKPIIPSVRLFFLNQTPSPSNILAFN